MLIDLKLDDPTDPVNHQTLARSRFVGDAGSLDPSLLGFHTMV
jgi:hypothetical protein